MVETLETSHTWSRLGNCTRPCGGAIRGSLAARALLGLSFCHLSHAYPTAPRCTSPSSPALARARKSSSGGRSSAPPRRRSSPAAATITPPPRGRTRPRPLHGGRGGQRPGSRLLRGGQGQLDPAGIMNPGKLLQARRLSAPPEFTFVAAAPTKGPVIGRARISRCRCRGIRFARLAFGASRLLQESRRRSARMSISLKAPRRRRPRSWVGIGKCAGEIAGFADLCGPSREPSSGRSARARACRTGPRGDGSRPFARDLQDGRFFDATEQRPPAGATAVDRRGTPGSASAFGRRGVRCLLDFRRRRGGVFSRARAEPPPSADDEEQDDEDQRRPRAPAPRTETGARSLGSFSLGSLAAGGALLPAGARRGLSARRLRWAGAGRAPWAGLGCSASAPRGGVLGRGHLGGSRGVSVSRRLRGSATLEPATRSPSRGPPRRVRPIRAAMSS